MKEKLARYSGYVAAGIGAALLPLVASAQLVTLPSAGDIIASSSQASSPIFNSTLPIALFGLGFAIGAIIAVWIFGKVLGAVKKVFARGGRRGGRRRR